MTCIVGMVDKGNVYIGGDSYGVGGYSKTERGDKKVFVRHGIAYGFTSSFRMGQILMCHTEEQLSGRRESDLFSYIVCDLIPHYRAILKQHGFAEVSNNQEAGGVFLIGIDGGLFYIDSDFQVGIPTCGYDAVGCGKDIALGAMKMLETSKESPDEKIRRSIGAASQFSAGVGGKINVVSV